MSRRPRALITGFSGMVGSHLADYLLEHTDWDVHGLIRWNDDLANVDHLLPRIDQKDRLGVVYGDLNDHPSLQKAIGAVQPDYVFHLAAQSYPKTSFDAPLETLQTNILGAAGGAARSDPLRRSGADRARVRVVRGVWPRAEPPAADPRRSTVPPGVAGVPRSARSAPTSSAASTPRLMACA